MTKDNFFSKKKKHSLLLQNLTLNDIKIIFHKNKISMNKFSIQIGLNLTKVMLIHPIPRPNLQA